MAWEVHDPQCNAHLLRSQKYTQKTPGAKTNCLDIQIIPH